MKLVTCVNEQQPTTSVADGIAIVLRKIEELERELILLQSQGVGTSSREVIDVKGEAAALVKSLSLYTKGFMRNMQNLLEA